MKMNKKCISFIAIGISVGAVLHIFFKSKKDKETFRRQIDEYENAISETLSNSEITDFENFADYLLEYYGIKAVKNPFWVEYSSDNYVVTVTSNELQTYGKSGYSYDFDDLEMFFSSNRELWV